MEFEELSSEEDVLKYFSNIPEPALRNEYSQEDRIEDLVERVKEWKSGKDDPVILVNVSGKDDIATVATMAALRMIDDNMSVLMPANGGNRRLPSSDGREKVIFLMPDRSMAGNGGNGQGEYLNEVILRHYGNADYPDPVILFNREVAISIIENMPDESGEGENGILEKLHLSGDRLLGLGLILASLAELWNFIGASIAMSIYGAPASVTAGEVAFANLVDLLSIFGILLASTLLLIVYLRFYPEDRTRRLIAGTAIIGAYAALMVPVSGFVTFPGYGLTITVLTLISLSFASLGLSSAGLFISLSFSFTLSVILFTAGTYFISGMRYEPRMKLIFILSSIVAISLNIAGSAGEWYIFDRSGTAYYRISHFMLLLSPMSIAGLFLTVVAPAVAIYYGIRRIKGSETGDPLS